MVINPIKNSLVKINMIKFIQKQLDLPLISTALIFALIYCLMFNTSVVLHKYEYYQVSFVSAIFELLKQFIYTYTTAFIFFFGFAIHRLIFIIGSIFLFFYWCSRQLLPILSWGHTYRKNDACYLRYRSL